MPTPPMSLLFHNKDIDPLSVIFELKQHFNVYSAKKKAFFKVSEEHYRNISQEHFGYALYNREIVESQQVIETLDDLNDKQLEQFMVHHKAAEIKKLQETIQEKNDLRESYDKAWEHAQKSSTVNDEFNEYINDQFEASIRYDCSTDEEEQLLADAQRDETPLEYRERVITREQANIDYYTEQIRITVELDNENPKLSAINTALEAIE